MDEGHTPYDKWLNLNCILVGHCACGISRVQQPKNLLWKCYEHLGCTFVCNTPCRLQPKAQKQSFNKAFPLICTAVCQ